MTLMPADMELSVRVDQREDLAGGVAAAVLSEDGQYRYLLTRIWDRARKPLVVVMLNPSTADAFVDDPTIRRLAGPKGFARAHGAGGIVVANLFALRSTDPRALLHHDDPVGPLNDAFIRQASDMADTVLCAWGAAGIQDDRGPRVVKALKARRVPLVCLGVTSTGQPRHPLYVPGTAALEPYEGDAS
jgi:hypothetical protein